MSADPAHAGDVQTAAEWVAAFVRAVSRTQRLTAVTNARTRFGSPA